MDKEFVARSASSVFIVAILGTFIYTHSICFDYVFIFALGVLMAYEWQAITSSSQKRKQWALGGVLYIGATLLPLLYTKFTLGSHFLMYLFLMVWLMDTGAYLTGAKLKLGKHTITSISPKKSYEGLLGGIVLALIGCHVFAGYFLPGQHYFLLAITPLLCIVEQVSDITESYVKRKFGVKDSGDLIPGHGGVVDRLDGFLWTTGLYLLLLHCSHLVSTYPLL